MHADQIKQTWRSILVKALRERYGVTSREARTKVNAWLESVTANPKRLETSEHRELRSQRRAPPRAGCGLSANKWRGVRVLPN